MDALPDSMKLDFLPRLTGSFSTPAKQNPTSVMIEAAYEHHKMHARYINCEVPAASLADAVKGARAMGWLGFNCSIPHKIAIIDMLNRLGPSASLIGAVNCVVLRDGEAIGENTDGSGFLISLQSLTTVAGKRLVILGAGGAARAIAVESALAGAEHITIVNRGHGNGEKLAHLIAENTKTKTTAVEWNKPYHIPEEADVIVNATSVGFGTDSNSLVNVDVETLRANLIVADVIPNPPNTRFLQEAAKKGATTLDGLGMLVYQGVASIEHWTGQKADATVMRVALEQALGITHK